MRELDGGCSSPVAAFAVLEGERLTLRGMDKGGDGGPGGQAGRPPPTDNKKKNPPVPEGDKRFW
ncbi:hypothetical protein [uncultured Subdoligranulum sp.]|uniref:hypothetical protein n=1 Tax=uncultured Subdoligranulum sp. TaxID=512298 RepID=UPI00260A40B4|nr:hypothetical protein [uncultured Subdoligranulum sp.]